MCRWRWLQRHVPMRRVLTRGRGSKRLLRMLRDYRRLSILSRRSGRVLRLHRRNTLVALCVEAWIDRRFCISKLLPTLKWSMLDLLPCRHVWWWRHIYPWHWICIRRHVCLHALACQRGRYVCWSLFVWGHDGGRLLLLCAIKRHWASSLRRGKIRATRRS